MSSFLANLPALTPELVIYAGFALIIVVLASWLIILEQRLKRLTAGKDGKSLEQFMGDLAQAVTETDRINSEIKKHLISMEERIRRSVQHVKTIRFNPFKDQGQGSNQSFATALLDERGNGVVISSLYTRDNVSVYAKPILNRHSDYELSQEETASLSKQ